MKQRIEILVVLLITGISLFMSGCGKSREDITKELLSQKYGEEFNVYSIRSEGSVYYATCSPIDNSEIVFEARMVDGLEQVDEDDYFERLYAHNINDILEEDLKLFFPKAFIHTTVSCWPKNDITNLKGLDIVDLNRNIEKDSFYIQAAYVDIYYDGDIGTNKLYKEEYDYFTNKVEEYIKEEKMLPITISIIKVDDETIERLRSYYEKNVGKGESYFNTHVLEVDDFKLGIVSIEDCSLGNPPNISACFQKDKPAYLSDENEYIRRRELLENAP